MKIVFHLVTLSGYKIFKAMDLLRFKYRSFIQIFLGSLILLIFFSGKSYSQNCPAFEIKQVNTNDSSPAGGSVVIGINSNQLYTQDNFQIRQKEREVTGPIGYEVDFQISRNELIIRGLKKSDDLYLKEYVVLFSDKGCKNSQIVEVGTFKIN